MRRLAKKGAIRRLLPKSPAFVIVPPEHRTTGLPPVEWWLDDLMAHFRRLLSRAAIGGRRLRLLAFRGHGDPGRHDQVVATDRERPSPHTVFPEDESCIAAIFSDPFLSENLAMRG
ncbi:hypothetical protein ABIB66_001194 [Bradyrhizobium sp. F1.13.3]